MIKKILFLMKAFKKFALIKDTFSAGFPKVDKALRSYF